MTKSSFRVIASDTFLTIFKSFMFITSDLLLPKVMIDNINHQVCKKNKSINNAPSASKAPIRCTNDASVESSRFVCFTGRIKAKIYPF